MYYICCFFLISNFLSSQSIVSISMNEKPLKSKRVTLSEIGTLIDEDGFYKNLDTSISEDGKVAIIDHGNYLIHVYKSDGTFITKFGKEGQGPGELSGGGRIYAFNTRIVLRKFNRMSIFDYSGNLVKEIKERNFGKTALFKTKNGFKYVYDMAKGRPTKIISKEFDLDGNLVTEIIDPEFEAKMKSMPKSAEEYQTESVNLQNIDIIGPWT